MIWSPLQRRSAASFFAILAAALLVCGWGGCDNRPRVASKLILIDNIHSSKQAPEFGMPWNDYRYSSLNGEKKLFDFLGANGYPHRYVTPADAVKLTPGVLRGVRILMLDLIDPRGLDYSPDEIETVRKFVNGGGSLLVVGDHTNVYEHARRSNALLKPMGVEIDYGSGIERDPDLATADGYWIQVRSFADHPVTREVEAVFFQTGATLSTGSCGP